MCIIYLVDRLNVKRYAKTYVKFIDRFEILMSEHYLYRHRRRYQINLQSVLFKCNFPLVQLK